MRKRRVGLIILFLTGIVAGAAWKHFNIAPFPQLHRWTHPQSEMPSTTNIPERNAIAIVLYRKRVPLFIDRHYFDSSETEVFDGSYLIQVQRHRTNDLKLLVKKDLIAYRILSEANDNTPFADWDRSNLKAKVEGAGCTHEIIIQKKLAMGEHFLPAGGPIASSPLLVRIIGENASDPGFEIQSR
jgi:hypothetical protein